MKQKKFAILNILVAILALAYLYISNFKSNIIVAVFFIALSIFNYLYFYKKDVFNPMAIYSLVWLGGIGLSLLQLTTDQNHWSPFVWINMLLAYLMFLLGYLFMQYLTAKQKIKLKQYTINVQRLYKSIIFILLFSYINFIIEAVNLKFVPLFSKDMAAYQNFHYLFLHYFTILIAIIPALTVIYKSNGGMRKVLLINIASFVLPVLLVSRQLILFEGILLIVSYNYCYKKLKLKYLAALGVAGIILFSLASNLRNQNIDYIYKVANFKSQNKSVFAQPYLYVTMNFENLRNAITNAKGLTYGANTLSPFIALLNLDKYIKLPSESYLTNPYFNTSTFLLPFYLDFGLAGVVVGTLILGMLCGFIYSYMINNLKNKDLSIVIYSAICYCIIFVFFVNFFINLNLVFDLFVMTLMFIYTIQSSKEQQVN